MYLPQITLTNERSQCLSVNAQNIILEIIGVSIMQRDDRFIKIHSQKGSTLSMEATEIWVDKATGVNYIFHQAGYAGGLTVLLGSDGKPVVTPIGQYE